MSKLKNRSIIFTLMLITFASCSKFEPLQEVQSTELNNDVDARLMSTGDSDDGEGNITDPDHDEDHDKDKKSK